MTALLHQIFVQRRKVRILARDFRALVMVVVAAFVGGGGAEAAVVVAAGCTCGDDGCVLVFVFVAIIFASILLALLFVLGPI